MMKNLLIALLVLFSCTNISAQTIVCLGSPCSANDFVIDSFFLGDALGNPTANGACNIGETVEEHLWLNFTANTAAPRYSLYIHYNLYIDDIFLDTIDICLYDGEQVILNRPLDTHTFDWECGSDVRLDNLYMSWQTNSKKDCDCTRAKCYLEDSYIVPTPLVANYSYAVDCDIDYYAQFTSIIKGGNGPYYYFWNFGDGTTSTLENPSHTFPNQGPFVVSLVVTDITLNIVSTIEQLVVFRNGDIPLTITPPPNIAIEGCGITDISPFVYSDVPVTITEDDLINMGGSVEYNTDTIILSYVDTSSGTCPITITRTFTAIDSCDETHTATQEITVDDTIPPTASPLSDIIIACIDDPIPDGDISIITDATDDCSTVTITNEVPDVSDNQESPETIIRTYTLRDDCNNETLLTQEIIIVEKCPDPIIVSFDFETNCITDFYAEFTSTVIGGVGPYTYFWNLGDGTTSTLENPTHTFPGTGPYNISLTVTDSVLTIQSYIEELVTFQANDITLNITAPPKNFIEGCGLISLSPFVYSEVPVTITETELTEMGGSIEYFTDSITLSYVDTSSGTCPITITRTFSAEDSCTTTDTVTQEIIINDTTPPTASPLDSIIIACKGDSIPDADTSLITDATDNCSTVTITNEVPDVSDNQESPETIIRTYTLRDECNNEKIITQEITIVEVCPDPIVVSFDFKTNCITDFYEEFTSTVIGGVGPYTYFWNFGDGTTSTLENPTHTFPGTGPYNISLTVTDSALTIQSYIEELVVFKANDITLNITAPPKNSIEGCGLISLSPFVYSEVPVTITETELETMGGSIEYYTDTITLSYVDTSSGTCPITITRTFLAEDSCLTTDTATQGIIVDDTTAPTASPLAPIIIACKGDPIPDADISIITDADDNCSTVIVTNEIPDISDNQVSPETIIRTYTLRDDCNNETIITQEIIIETICTKLVVDFDYTTNCITDFYAEYTPFVTGGIGPYTYYWDLGDGTTSTLENPTHTYANGGPFTVTLTVTDVSSNVDSTIQQVLTFEANNIPLTITAPFKKTMEGCSVTDVSPFAYSEVPVTITENDLLSMGGIVDYLTNTITLSYVDTSSGTCPVTIIRTFTAIDSCTTTDTATQEIKIEDTIAPTASPLAPIVIACKDDPIPDADTSVITDASDNCSTVTITNEVPDVSDNQESPETIIRTYTLRDECNNETIITQEITIVEDCTEPLIVNYTHDTNCITDFYAEYTAFVTGGIGPYTYYWDLGDGTTSTLENPTHTYSNGGPFNVSLTVTDSALQINSYLEQLITFKANDIPLTITAPSNKAIDGCDISDISPLVYSEVPVTITETELTDMGGSIEYFTDSITLSYVDTSSSTCPITITRTFSAEDSCTTTDTATQEITINDTLAPTASPLAPIVIACKGDSIPNADSSIITDAEDNCSTVTITNEVPDVSDNQVSPETIIRTYTLRDDCNNETILIQEIIIEAVCPDPLVVNYDFETDCIIDFYAEFNSSVAGGVGPYTYYWDLGDGTTSTLKNPTHTYSNGGPFNVSLTVTDSALQINSYLEQLITFKANDIPLIITAPANKAIDGCDISDISPLVYSEVPVTITEAELTDIGGSIEYYTDSIILSYIDTSSGTCPITITRIFSAEDSCTTKDLATQEIIVEDTTPPTASSLSDIVIVCIGDPIPDANISVITDAADNCSTVTITNEVPDVSDNQNSPETIIRTYTLRDDCNNETILTQNIIIEGECLEPLIANYTYSTDCLRDFYAEYTPITIGGSGPYTYFWNLGDGTTSTLENPRHTYADSGPFNVTLTIIDAFLNINSSVTQLITFRANDIPLNIYPADDNNIQGCGLSSLAPYNFSDVPVNITESDMIAMGGSVEHYTELTAFNYVDTISNTCPITVTRTFLAIDSCNTESKMAVDIIIEDTLPPTASALAPITVTCKGDFIPKANVNGLTGVSDNCSTVTITNEVPDVSDNQESPETIIRTYTLRDECNNKTIITQEIIIETVCPEICDLNSLEFSTISEIVTPNGDQNHDFFEVKTTKEFPENSICNVTLEVQILNRWGVSIFKTKDYNNTWNGNSNTNGKLPSGTYFYIIKIANTTRKPIQGQFFLGTE